LKQLNQTQKDSVLAVKGPVLIFAGAGSGKTRVLTHKIHFLIKENLYKPEEILAVTFTNKAAKEMKSRVESLLKTPSANLNIGTFHSICARMLRKEIHHLGYTNDFAIYDTKDQQDLIKVVMNDMNQLKESMTARTVRSQISYYKNLMLTPEEVALKARIKKEKEIAEIYRVYQQYLKLNNAVDFDDLLLLPIELFKKKPAILTRYRKTWKYILVDEYQDTNRPQFMLISKLAEKHKQICVVGDDDQSIYGWRGADIRNILDFKKHFVDCKVFKLENNYRSTQQILNAASSVVENNIYRESKTLNAVRGAGEKLAVFETVDEMEEADAIVSALEKEIKTKKRTFNHFAVLYRTNAQSRALEDGFRRQGIPYNIVGGIRFYERKEVKDILAYLRLIINLKDTISLRRVINFPPRGIGQKTITKCVEQAEKTNSELIDVLSDPAAMGIRGKQANSLTSFYDIIKKYNELVDKLSTSELVRTLVEEAKILHHYKGSINPEDQERYQNMEELLNSIDVFSARNPDSSLRDFLEEVTLLTAIDQWNDDDNRVTLMTLHSAKGLEFPVVFIAGLEDGLFPLYSSFNDAKQLEEERRLFYVGLTRAEEKVYLMYATQRRKMGIDYDVGLVSRFLREIPVDQLEQIKFESALTRRVVTRRSGKKKVKIKRSITSFDDFKIGDKVEHAMFGIGTIKALSGSGENQRVGVVFNDGTRKKLIVKYANLKKVES